jgi:stage II sporulation protein D
MFVKIILFFLGLLSLSASAYGSENIRVALMNNQKTVVVSSRTGFIDSDKTVNHNDAKRLKFNASSMGRKPVRLRAAGEFIKVNGKSYKGWVELRSKRNGLMLVINELDIEDYLRGVLAGEVPDGWEYEALKAQAIVARSYALYQKKMSGSRAYHIVATVNSQVYEGSMREYPREARAIEDTRGLVIVYQGKIIPAFYHSSCGGQTESADELWGIDAPFLRGVDCDCQRISRYGIWEKRISLRQIVNALRHQGLHLDDILGMSIKGITPAGRVRAVAISSPRGELNIPAESLRAAIGNSTIPSVFFEIEITGKSAVFSGRGSGHGVGLCQWGTEEMAERGCDYPTILSHYYPGTDIIQIP